MAGVDLPTVKELMEHKDITMTLRYTHLSSDHKRQAVKALEHFSDEVPRMFLTGHTGRADEASQVFDFASMGR